MSIKGLFFPMISPGGRGCFNSFTPSPTPNCLSRSQGEGANPVQSPSPSSYSSELAPIEGVYGRQIAALLEVIDREQGTAFFLEQYLMADCVPAGKDFLLWQSLLKSSERKFLAAIEEIKNLFEAHREHEQQRKEEYSEAPRRAVTA